MTYDLILFGNVTIDDTVLYDGTLRMGCFGGDTIYGNIAGRFFSNRTEIVAPVGDDYSAESFNKLNDLGFDMSGMPMRQVPTHRNWVIYEEDGRRTWVNRTPCENFYVLSPQIADVPEKYFQTKAFLLLAMDLNAQFDLVKDLPHDNRIIALDPQEDYIFGCEQMIKTMISNVDIFMPSEVEVFRLLGHTDFDLAAESFFEMGVKTVVFKLGENGCRIYDSVSNRKWTFPIFRTNAKDTTGAGDSFCGGFMAQYAVTGNLTDAAVSGTVAASFAVEDFGSVHFMDITKDMVKHRIDQYMSSNYQLFEGENGEIIG